MPLELTVGTPLTVRVEGARSASVDDPDDPGDANEPAAANGPGEGSRRSLTGELVALRGGFAVLLGSDSWT